MTTSNKMQSAALYAALAIPLIALIGYGVARRRSAPRFERADGEHRSALNVEAVSWLERDIQRGSVEDARTIAERNTQLIDGFDAAAVAVTANRPEMLKCMLACGWHIDGPWHDGRPLSLAAVAGNAAMVKRLLAGHADPNARPEHGWTPLMMACRTPTEFPSMLAHTWTDERAKVVGMLLKAGARVNEQIHPSEWNEPPVVRSGGRLVAEPLEFPRDAYRSLPDTTALLVATRYGFTDVVRRLLEGHADPAIASASGETSLQMSIRLQRTEIAALLRRYGAKSQDGSGEISGGPEANR